MKIIPVILSGGTGTRLWPLSRKQHPKQYIPLTSDKTMLQETILRLNGLKNISPPIIVCNVEHRFFVVEQCQQIGIANPTILLEAFGRNTAPAIAAAALQILKIKDDGIMLVLPADHVVEDIKEMHSAICIAKKQAQEDKIVTFGIVPTNANTGYGYIKSSKIINDKVSKIDMFTEKPNLEEAQSFLQQGNYLWNSGMFMFKPSKLIEELTIYSPEIIGFIREAINKAKKDLDFIRLDKASYRLCPSNSIDYALMEKSKNAVVVSLNINWSDIGSWVALHNYSKKDINGNVINGDVFVEETSNTYITGSQHMLVTIGVKDLIIVDTPNATLIAAQDKVQKVKEFVKRLELESREERLCHRKVYRPWGWYDSIENGLNFQVKRLHINPGAKISLQLHHKRSEHWVVINGVALVINGEETLTLKEGDSTYIPVDVKHSLENKTNKPLEIIEVQSGSYLGEDDIVRFEDIYGRL